MELLRLLCLLYRLLLLGLVLLLLWLLGHREILKLGPLHCARTAHAFIQINRLLQLSEWARGR